VFRSIVDLQAAINRYLAEHNRGLKSSPRTGEPEEMIVAVS
jgi:hypothetical protein